MLSCARVHKHWNPVHCYIGYRRVVVGIAINSEDGNLMLDFLDTDSHEIAIVGIVVGSM